MSLAAAIFMSGTMPVEVSAAGTTVGTSSNGFALQHPSGDKVAYLHDGSLLVGYFDGSQGVIKQVTNPSTAPVVGPAHTIHGDEVTLYTLPSANSTDIWIQSGGELTGAPLEVIQHGVYNGSTFTWDTVTTIPGTTSSGRQDPSVTWTGKWLIASWWDDTLGSNSDTVYVNWTADKTAKTGWLTTPILLTPVAHNSVQVSIRHSAKLGATIAVYGAQCRIWTRTLLDSKTNPSLANWTAASLVDPTGDDCEFGYGGPQIAIDENTGKIHVVRAVTNSQGTARPGVTYWLGTPDAAPMGTGKVTWNPRLIIDNTGSNTTDPPDVAGAVDSTGKVYVFWTTSVSAGVIKYVTLVSPFTSASAKTTLATTGTKPRYPHVPAEAPLNRGYVPVVYQSGANNPFSIFLDTSISTGAADTTPPSVPTALTAVATTTPQVNLSWNASTDNVGVTGYTVYRNGATVGTAGASGTPTYTDATVASSTTYSYSVDAFDGAGNHSAQSAPVQVTTPTPDTTPPSVPTGLAAAVIATPQVNLSWNASTDNVGVTGYRVYRNGTALGTAAASGTPTYADATVASSTTYSYTVDAFDAAGNHSAQSAPLPVTTPAPVAPTVQWVQGGAAGTGSRVVSTTISLPGMVHAGDLLAGWFGQYDSSGQVQVSDNVNGAWTRSASTTFSNGAGDLALYYRQNAASSPSGVTVTIAASVATYLEGAVSDYTGVALTGALDQVAVAKGVGAAVDSGATGAVGAGELVVGGVITGGNPGSTTPGASQGKTFTTRAQVGSGSSYVEDVLASAAGIQNGRATLATGTDWYAMGAVFRPAAAADTTPPSVPTGLTAAATSTPQVNLSWNASTDNVGVSGYTVYRNGATLTTVGGSTLTYADKAVVGLTTYSYTVDAFDAAGNHSAQSAAASATTPDATPPTVPAGVGATAISPTEIDLSWSASTDNVAVTGYTVYRNGAFLATTGVSPTSWKDTTASPSTTYSYTVDAFDAAGNHSPRSAPAAATTPGVPDSQPPTVPTGVAANAGPVGEVDVSWSASTDNVGVTGYTVYRNGSALGTVSGTTLAYADKTAAGTTTYSYTVDAFDAAGNHSVPSAAATVTTPDWTPPTTPTGLAAAVISSGEIDLSWGASTDNVGVTGYTVYRNGVAIATTSPGTLTYANTGLGHGFTYAYTVDAFDAAGNHSPQSAPVSATTPDDIPPTMPGGLTASATSPTSVAVSWSASTDNVAVTGYDVYRDSTLLKVLGPAVLNYTDTVAAGSTHSYTVDAFDAAGNHSPSPTPISVTTPTALAVPKFLQGNVVTTGGRFTSIPVTLGPVAQGDLLVGWFGQYDSTGQVTVSDSVNGAWTRAPASTTWAGGPTAPGDIALYYFANSAAAPSGLTITTTAATATYLQAGVAEYSGVAAVNPLDQVVVGQGSSASADSGLTAAVSAGELVYGGLAATNGAGTLTPGASQGMTFVMRSQSSSGTQGEEDIVAGAAGQQHTVFTFPTSVPWFVVCAVFRPA